jgi:hypothetical protein
MELNWMPSTRNFNSENETKIVTCIIGKQSIGLGLRATPVRRNVFRIAKKSGREKNPPTMDSILGFSIVTKNPTTQYKVLRQWRWDLCFLCTTKYFIYINITLAQIGMSWNYPNDIPQLQLGLPSFLHCAIQAKPQVHAIYNNHPFLWYSGFADEALFFAAEHSLRLEIKKLPPWLTDLSLVLRNYPSFSHW